MFSSVADILALPLCNKYAVYAYLQMLRTSENIKSPSGLLTTPPLCIPPLNLHAKYCMAWMVFCGPYHWYGMAALPPMCILPLHQGTKYAMVSFGIV